MSHDPVAHVGSATLDGVVVASVPLTAQQIRHAGGEGQGYLTDT